LLVPSPQSAKLGGYAARAHGAHTEELYQVADLPDTFREFNRLLQHWERVHNILYYRQALGYLTPAASLHQLKTSHLIRKGEVCGRQWTGAPR